MGLGEDGACDCARCNRDHAFLLRYRRPKYEARKPRIRLVDLFCGCGGMTLGAAEAARAVGFGIEVRLALDVDTDACDVYAANFPGSHLHAEKVERWFDGALGSPVAKMEQQTRLSVGRVD